MSGESLLPLSSLQLAVALKYEAGRSEAPRVIAKGHGHVAERIVALAEANDVVIGANPELAHALGGLELDETIPLELFEAVAEVIGFILRARSRIEDGDRTAPSDVGGL